MINLIVVAIVINLHKKSVHTTGGRKSARARVFLSSGNGGIIVNSCGFDDYFSSLIDKDILHTKLKEYELTDMFDIMVTVHGGGKSAQLQAVIHVIIRALSQWIKNFDLTKLGVIAVMRSDGWLTRVANIVERKKYGRPKARARQQFSKR